jgi:penicillin-binding protein 1A
MSEESQLHTPPSVERPMSVYGAASGRDRGRFPPTPAESARPGDSLPPVRLKRRLRKLRFASILSVGLALAFVSFLYGIFLAVASDLPRLDDRYQFTHARNSILLDDQGKPLGVLSEQNRILLSPNQIPRIVKDAVVAIEDKRFYTESGVDPRGIVRAALEDVLHGHSVQGGSTIAEQFVKNALEAQSQRTVFEKLREAALAFQLTHKWPKEKILSEYLNTIYFGEGAYGIESAAQVYFGHEPNNIGCGLPGAPLCLARLQPWQAALLAGIIASPSGFDPAADPRAAQARREVVLADMLNQHYLTEAQYQESIRQPLPARAEIQPPQAAPVDGLQTGYFTSWVEQQLLERYSAQRALEGGLTVHTTLDLGLQRAAERAVDTYLPGPEGPTASLVAIENSTGDVRAMVGGRNYDETPFNLATAGERQPGSSFKAFDLAAALEHGIPLDSSWVSAPKVFNVPGTDGHEKFYVHNDNNAYVGPRTLLEATTWSDNSVFAEVGMHVGTRNIASIAHKMGIRTPISTNPSMTIGGLKVGVTPIDMAHAYETLAENGRRVGSSLVSDGGPSGIQEVAAPAGQALPDGHSRDINRVEFARVLPGWVAEQETDALETVIKEGTGRRAAIGQFAAGKTGTTSNFGDAWFVGWDKKYTVAVWVGYPNKLVSMSTDYDGGPVEGGTYPALIWRAFQLGAIGVGLERAELAAAKTNHGVATEGTGGSGLSNSPQPEATDTRPGSATNQQSSKQTGHGGAEHTAAAPAPTQPTPKEPTPQAEANTPAPTRPESTPSSGSGESAPSGGGGSSGEAATGGAASPSG